MQMYASNIPKSSKELDDEFSKQMFDWLAEITTQDFGERGNPTVQLVCGTEFAEESKQHEAEWREDKEFVKQMEEIP
jgi:hypothetical protein